MSLSFRLAGETDFDKIIAMLSDDTLGTAREKKDELAFERYKAAFQKIREDANQELTVAEFNGAIVATFQLSFIPYLTYQGGTRCQVEAVRVDSTVRGQGLGTKVFDYIIRRAKEKNCHLIQLTTDKKRSDAIRFYESLGFHSTHEGMKLHI